MEEFKDIALLMKQFELIALNKSTDDDFRLKEVRIIHSNFCIYLF